AWWCGEEAVEQHRHALQFRLAHGRGLGEVRREHAADRRGAYEVKAAIALGLGVLRYRRQSAAVGGAAAAVRAARGGGNADAEGVDDGKDLTGGGGNELGVRRVGNPVDEADGATLVVHHDGAGVPLLREEGVAL